MHHFIVKMVLQTRGNAFINYIKNTIKTGLDNCIKLYKRLSTLMLYQFPFDFMEYEKGLVLLNTQRAL